MEKSYEIIRLEYVDENKYLDDKRERFARDIVAGEGLLKAYRNAYGSSATDDDKLAMDQAITLARVPQVANRITTLETERRSVRNTTRESMIADLKKMSEVSISDYFVVDNGMWVLKHPSLWTNEMKRACSKIKPTKFGIELEIQGKQWIFEKISDLMGFSLPHEEPQKVNLYDGKTIEELRKAVIDMSDVLDVTDITDAE